MFHPSTTPSTLVSQGRIPIKNECISYCTLWSNQMSSDDDKPLVPALQRKKKVKKQKKVKEQKPAPKSVDAKPKQPRYSKFADMHAKEGKEGQTASEDEVSEDDRDQPDESYITSDDVDNNVSDDMYAVYHQSLSSQASQHGFGTPIFKKRAKERGTSRGSIFDGIVAKHEGKRKKAAKSTETCVLPLNPRIIESPSLHQPSVTAVVPPNRLTMMSPSTLRPSMTAVLSLTAVSHNVSPFTNRTSLTAVLPMNPPPILSPSTHLSSVTSHQQLFEHNVGPREKVNRMKLKTRLSFPPKDCDLSLKLNDTSLHSETTKLSFSSTLHATFIPEETVRSLQTTAHLLTSKLSDMSLNTEVPANAAATDHLLTPTHHPAGNIDLSPTMLFHNIVL
jgi:hypothetical protein